MPFVPISTDSKAVTGQHLCNSTACRQPKAEANTSSLRGRYGVPTYTNPSSLRDQSLSILVDTLKLHTDTSCIDIPYGGHPTTPVVPAKADTGESAGKKEPNVPFDFRVAFELGKLLAHAEEHDRKQNQLLVKQDCFMRELESHEVLIWQNLTMLKKITEELRMIKRAPYIPKISQPPPQHPQ